MIINKQKQDQNARVCLNGLTMKKKIFFNKACFWLTNNRRSSKTRTVKTKTNKPKIHTRIRT